MSIRDSKCELPLSKVLSLLKEGIEVWRPVLGYEKSHEVSSFGRVKSLARYIQNKKGYMYPVKGKLLRLGKGDYHGHLSVALNGKGTYRLFYVHRLVLSAFVGPCPKGMQCCHFPDRDPTNNKLNNLTWGTPSQNSAHSVVHGTRVVTKGEKNGRAKLTRKDVEEIR